MDAIEVMMSEHRTIERVLAALESYATLVGSGDVTDREELGCFVRFLREYADRLHHGKEEELLFVRMVEAGFSKESGPVAVMLSEHDRGRELVGILHELAERPGPWTAADAHQAAAAACGFATLLRAHISKEDCILYPMAERHLAADVLNGIATEIERRAPERQDSERELLALADELESRWVTARRPSPGAHATAPATSHAHACGCHRETAR